MRGAPRSVAQEPLDLQHVGISRAIGAYVVPTDDGLALFDCGPATCLQHLRDGLASRGLSLDDVHHILLSHIHLDHAGAAGAIVRDHPHIQVHVSAIGAPHVIAPERLEASARRLYGTDFDRLWGALQPVPEANVHVVGDDVLGLACFPTPGHAAHHVSYLHADGTLFGGDVAGVRFAPGRFVLPPLPPPEVDLEAWERSIDELQRRMPRRLALIHFGVFEDVADHLERLREALGRWSAWSEAGLDEPSFTRAITADIAASDPELVEHYLEVVPAWHAFRGLERYWRKRRDAEQRFRIDPGVDTAAGWCNHPGVHELEIVSHTAYRQFYGERAVETGGATCFRIDEAAASPMLNRVVGLGLADAATDEDIDAALAVMEGVTHYVAISPFASPSDLGQRLEARGLEPGWGWMLFERDASPAATPTTTLRVVEVGASDAERWARVVVTAYGLPETVVPVTATAVERPGWTCWLALDGDEPAAAAALWAEGDVGYLGFAGTMPEHRGKGGQGALFAARIGRARELGCSVLVTETGEQIPDRPSSSYRNIIRFGFRERFVVHHRMRSAAPTHGREMPYDV